MTMTRSKQINAIMSEHADKYICLTFSEIEGSAAYGLATNCEIHEAIGLVHLLIDDIASQSANATTVFPVESVWREEE